MSGCVFCQIVEGEIPSYKIYEDEHTLAFLDKEPSNKGHTLVIPKEHHVNLMDTPEEVLSHIMNTVKKIAIALNKKAEGVSLDQNNGQAAGQVVDHIHFHVIPRFMDDGHHVGWKRNVYGEGEAAQAAEEIKRLL